MTTATLTKCAQRRQKSPAAMAGIATRGSKSRSTSKDTRRKEQAALICPNPQSGYAAQAHGRRSAGKGKVACCRTIWVGSGPFNSGASLDLRAFLFDLSAYCDRRLCRLTEVGRPALRAEVRL